MRIATYNVWNENKGIGDRTEQILSEIENVNADVIALQEITPWFYQEHLSLLKAYPYSKFGKYTNEEEQIVAIDKFMHEQKTLADYFIVLGDFNSGINSSVHRFMLGEQTINGNEAKPYWYEVSSVYAAVNGKELLPTLDCINNPRWKGKAATYAPENFDRIYVMDVRNGYQFNNVELFGTEVSNVNNLCASDHYGVVADINFLKSN